MKMVTVVYSLGNKLYRLTDTGSYLREARMATPTEEEWLLEQGLAGEITLEQKEV